MDVVALEEIAVVHVGLGGALHFGFDVLQRPFIAAHIDIGYGTNLLVLAVALAFEKFF